MHRQSKKQIGSHDYYYIFGKHAALAALNNDNRVVNNVLCTQEMFDAHSNVISKHPYKITTNSIINDTLAFKQIHQGIIVRVKSIFQSNISELDLENPKIKLAILDQITDPQNIGAIIRSAAAFNINTIIMPSDNTPDENATIAKTACGCLELVQIIKVTNLKSTMDYLKKQGFWIVGLDSSSNTIFNKQIVSDRMAIVLGSEDTGPRRLTKEACDFLTKIPMSSEVESLNVSNAAAIVFYELYKEHTILT
jgi:23S rRNA (guanosine2251-2'-O)-methyltransferase